VELEHVDLSGSRSSEDEKNGLVIHWRGTKGLAMLRGGAVLERERVNRSFLEVSWAVIAHACGAARNI